MANDTRPVLTALLSTAARPVAAADNIEHLDGCVIEARGALAEIAKVATSDELRALVEEAHQLVTKLSLLANRMSRAEELAERDDAFYADRAYAVAVGK